MDTVLALRALNLGDLVVAVPALRALRRAFPGRRVVLATHPRFAPVVSRIGGVELLPQHGLTPPALDGADLAVDLHHVVPDSLRALKATRPRRLLAFADPRSGYADGPEVVAGEHETRRWLRLVREVGAAGDPQDLLLARDGLPVAQDPPTIVHPGAAWGSKRWPAERFARVAARLRDDGHRVLVTGSAAEADLAATVTVAARLPPAANVAGRTTLPDLLDLVASARLVISGDTGIAHLASAFARPSVVLFGPASPRLWGPPELPRHAALWRGDGERHVMTDVVDPALLDIGVEEVLAAAGTVLGHG